MKKVYEKKESRLQKTRMLVAAVCMMAVLGGCGAPRTTVSQSILADTTTGEYTSYNMVGMDSGQMEAGAYPGEVAEEAPVERSGSAGMTEIDQSAANKGSEHKLIKTVDLSVETKEFEQVLGTLQSQVKEQGGYIENMETDNGSAYTDYRSNRKSRMTIRIPKEQTDGLLETVTDICNVVSRSESVEDVTLAYVDLESHKNVLRTEQARLVELLSRAETIEDILTIESRLSEVRYQIESMESQLRTYDNKVDYSTVYLYIEEVKDLTPVEEETVWERISGGFLERLEHLGEGFVEFIIWFLVNTPYLITFAVIVAAVVLSIKGMRRRIRKKKQKLQQAQQAQQQGQQQSQQQIQEQTQQSQK